eukprot:TRINITY_DN2058_c0_g1_i1.p1 TRINITY_DN2058_c0_g1~~TRINITY_DN2058_c0_g1_i1.p1  ORF type:complete len:844 (-),score=205.26 TRINITY_DN2058_c0_g1_i1:32-2563(-)
MDSEAIYIGVVGSSSVDKKSLIIMFYNSICQIKHLKSKNDMTIIDYTKKMEVKNTEIDFHLLEIDEGLVSHLDQHEVWSELEAFLFVFSDQKSLDEVLKMRDIIVKKRQASYTPVVGLAHLARASIGHNSPTPRKRRSKNKPAIGTWSVAQGDDFGAALRGSDCAGEWGCPFWLLGPGGAGNTGPDDPRPLVADLFNALASEVQAREAKRLQRVVTRRSIDTSDEELFRSDDPPAPVSQTLVTLRTHKRLNSAPNSPKKLSNGGTGAQNRRRSRSTTQLNIAAPDELFTTRSSESLLRMLNECVDYSENCAARSTSDSDDVSCGANIRGSAPHVIRGLTSPPVNHLSVDDVRRSRHMSLRIEPSPGTSARPKKPLPPIPSRPSISPMSLPSTPNTSQNQLNVPSHGSVPSSPKGVTPSSPQSKREEPSMEESSASGKKSPEKKKSSASKFFRSLKESPSKDAFLKVAKKLSFDTLRKKKAKGEESSSSSKDKDKESSKSPRISPRDRSDSVSCDLSDESLSISSNTSSSSEMRSKNRKGNLVYSPRATYEIMSKLSAKGGQGATYLVRKVDELTTASSTDDSTDIEKSSESKSAPLLVLKKICFMYNPRQALLAEQEARFLLSCSHENIVKAYDAWTETSSTVDGKLTKVNIVMEFCDGGDLSKRKQVKETEMKRLMYEVISGLRFLHEEKRKVHRDIKTDNIFMTKSGTFKLGDFGVMANLIGSPHVTRVGTEGYKAPEVHAGGYNEKVDIWSLGIVLAQLASTEDIFYIYGDIGLKLLINKVTKEELLEYIPRNDYDPKFIELVSAMLDVKPESRPSCAQILKHPYLSSIRRSSKANLHVK